MSHEYTNPSLPLTSDQKAVTSGVILASGEANYFDFIQHHESTGGSGIDAIYPSPADFASGIYETNRPDEGVLSDSSRESGIVHFSGGFNQFSNADAIDEFQITDFTIFNDYIHYDKFQDDVLSGILVTNPVISIPYLSDYVVSIQAPGPYF